MKKAVTILLGIIAALLIIVFIASVFFLSPIVKTAVEEAGPQVLGVDITLESADVQLLRGFINLQEMIIGNPEGFNTPYLFKLGELDIKIDVSSVLSDTIIINSILISGPRISYEKSLKTSNIAALLKNLEGEPTEKVPQEDEPKEEEEAETPTDKPAKKVIIKDFLLEGSRLQLSATLTGGHALVIPLPPIHLTDIGKESDGASLTEILSKVFRAIFGAITQAISGSVKLLGHGAKFVGTTTLQGAALAGDATMAAGGAALDGVQIVGGAAVDGVQVVGGAAINGAQIVGGAAVDGVQVVGGAAVGGAQIVGGAAVDGVQIVGGAAIDGVQVVGGAAIGGAKIIGGAAAGGAKAVTGGASKLFGGVKGLVTREEETDDETGEPVL